MYQRTELNFSEQPKYRGQSVGGEFAGSGDDLTTVEARLAIAEADIAALEAGGTSRAKLRFVS